MQRSGSLAAASVNVRLIDQGASELSIIVGVDEDDYEKALGAIYKAFVTEAHAERGLFHFKEMA